MLRRKSTTKKKAVTRNTEKKLRAAKKAREKKPLLKTMARKKRLKSGLPKTEFLMLLLKTDSSSVERSLSATTTQRSRLAPL